MDVLDEIEVAFHEAVRKNQLRKMMQNGMRELPAAEAPSPYGGPEALRDLHVALSGPNSALLSPDLVDMLDMNDEFVLSPTEPVGQFAEPVTPHALDTPTMSKNISFQDGLTQTRHVSNQQQTQKGCEDGIWRTTVATPCVPPRPAPSISRRASKDMPQGMHVFKLPSWSVPSTPATFIQMSMPAESQHRPSTPRTDMMRTAKKGKRIVESVHLPASSFSVVSGDSEHGMQYSSSTSSARVSPGSAPMTIQDLLRNTQSTEDASERWLDTHHRRKSTSLVRNDGFFHSNDSTMMHASSAKSSPAIQPDLSHLSTSQLTFPEYEFSTQSNCDGQTELTPLLSGRKRKSAQDIYLDAPLDSIEAKPRTHRDAEKRRRDALKYAFERLKTVLPGVEPRDNPWKVQLVEMAHDEIVRLRQDLAAKEQQVEALRRQGTHIVDTDLSHSFE